MSQEYEIRAFQESDSQQSVELLDIVFDGWPKFDFKCSALEHFQWKFLENPNKIYTGIIALDNERIIASTHTFIYQVKIWDNLVLGGMGADVGVHPDYRKQGIYNAISKSKVNYEREKGIGIRLHMSGNPILMERSKRRAQSGSGERVFFPFPLTRLIKVFDIGYHAEKNPGINSRVRGIGYSVLSLINQLKTRTTKTSGITIQIVSDLDSDYNLFWEEFSQSYDFIVNRDSSYMKWRFSEKCGDYTFLVAKENDKQVGLLVFRVNRFNQDYPQGFIVDLFSIDNRIDVAAVLIEAGLKRLKTAGANIVHWVGIQNGLYEKALKSYGFISYDIGFHLYYNTYYEMEKELEQIDKERAYLSYADFDII